MTSTRLRSIRALIVLLSCLCSPDLEAASPAAPSDRHFTIPAILKPGDASGRVREVQATLNRRLRDIPNEQSGPLAVPSDIVVEEVNGRRIMKGDAENGSSITLTVPTHWKPSGNDVDGFFITIDPEKDALKVDGVYGQHTFAAVMLFQEANNLQPTGEVDPVTLDKLEPMIPPNFILAKLMGWIMDSRFGRFSDSDTKVKVSQHGLLMKRLTAITAFLLIAIVSLIAYRIAHNLAESTRFLTRWLFTPSSSPWFTALREEKVFLLSAQFVPALVFCLGSSLYPAPFVGEKNPFPYLNTFQNWHVGVNRFGLAYASLIATMVALAIADAFNRVYISKRADDENPIAGIVGGAKRFAVLVGIVLIASAIVGRSPLFFVGGIGAFMAVILLVFKDSLLGFVASVNIVMNNMIKKGDWVEIEKYGADGDVTDISLNCIKVQNFDKTVTTIPTHALLTEGVKNWSGMHSSGGRRIKRSILIDMDSVKVCSEEMIERYKKIELIRDYVLEKEMELERYNLDRRITESPVNSRRLTNIGTFRAYLRAYLGDHELLRRDMTFLVRQLQPTQEGLPIEIYCYTKVTAWSDYEDIQADIFDHILSILSEFELRAFQSLSDFSPQVLELPATLDK